MANQFSFGSGELWAIGQNDPTPIKFGTLQNVQVDYNSNVVELHGAKQLPVAVGRGKMKVSGKAQFASIDARVMSNLFFGVASTTGKNRVASNEVGTVATAKITVANAATFVLDLGVVDKLTGTPLKRVTGTPAVGEYSVAAGVYTFDATANGKDMYIDYEYSVTGSGNTIVLTNQNLGEQPVFKLVLRSSYNNKQTVITFNRCVATSYTFQTQQENFTIPDFAFSAFTDDADELGTISTEV